MKKLKFAQGSFARQIINNVHKQPKVSGLTKQAVAVFFEKLIAEGLQNTALVTK